MRKICVVTSTRADYGIMSRLIASIEANCELELQLVVTGMHLSHKFGETYKEITSPISKKIDIEIEESPAHVLSTTIKKFDNAFKELAPDILLILGDRFEIMGVAQAAMLNNIAIAHIHGGETTEGAIDEAIRHSITKMSHLHFTSCKNYRNRVVQLGENPEKVFNVGALGVENIKKTELMSKNELEKALGLKFNTKNLLVTFHPATLEGNTKLQFEELLSALEEVTNTNIIITAPNCDEGNDVIFELINNFVEKHENAHFFKSLGMLKYLSTLQFVDAVVGNSSSGIIEVPSFKIGTVNIGNRQKGRVQSKSIINCKPLKNEILNAINSVYSTDFSNVKNPYEKNGTCDTIVEKLKSVSLDNIIQKSFYNIG